VLLGICFLFAVVYTCPSTRAGANDLEIIDVRYPDPVMAGDTVQFRVDVQKNVYDPMDFESILETSGPGPDWTQSKAVHKGYGKYISGHFHEWYPSNDNVGDHMITITIKWWQAGQLYRDDWDGFITVKSGNVSGVGGVLVPVDKFGLLAPYIGLASTILVAIVATVATAVYVNRVKHRKETQ